MKNKFIFAGLLALSACLTPERGLAVGTWTPLANPRPPGAEGFIRMMLLPDATVMVHEVKSLVGTTNWYRLTPDSHGHYINGTWTTNAGMIDTRNSYSGAVLRDGRLFVAGGEGGSGGSKAEVYSPLSNVWTSIPVPAGLLATNYPAISDADCKILPDGRVLVAPVQAAIQWGTFIFDPLSNSIAAGPACFGNQNEASWVKLPDDSILTIDINSTNSERYIPSLNQWIHDANVPVSLWDTNFEIGAAFLLADGRAFYLGGTGHTVFYTPSGTTNFGTWKAGPDIPDGQGTADVPAAMMVNGKILCVTGPIQVFGGPGRFYEFEPITTNFTAVVGPTGTTNYPGIEAGLRMLDLPDGTVLMCRVYDNILYVYQPDGVPLAAGKPVITSVGINGDGSLHLTGTGFNGISEGAAYGDDEQMDSNYPLVRFTDASGNVRYGRTYNWSRTSVMTGTNLVTTECTIPAGATLNDSVQVVANGNASAPVALDYALNGITWVDFNFGGTQNGTFANPWSSIAQGNFHSSSGGLIEIKAGSSSETLSLTKPVRIISYNGTVHIGP